MLKKYFFLLSVIFIMGFVIAQENNSNFSAFNSENISIANNSQITPADGLISSGIILRTITPARFDVGDVQFALFVENIGQQAERNIAPVISGDGFSTQNIVLIELLRAGERGYLLVNGNFKKSGNIILKIDLAGVSYSFNVSVKNEKESLNLESIKKEKQAILSALSKELELLKENYTLLENKIFEKKEQNYDISSVKLDEARKYIRAAETGILADDASSARVNLRLAVEELADQYKRVTSVKKLSSIAKIKDYAIIFSTLAGAIITFFALSELLKRKSEHIVNTVSVVKEKIATGKKKR